MKTLWLKDSNISLPGVSRPGGGGKGAYSWEFLVGICGPVLQILDPISDEKM